MKKIILLLIFINISLAAYSQSTIQPMDATECSSIFFKSLLDEDANTLGNILADDFSITNIDGQPVDRSMFLDAVSQKYLTIETGMLYGARTRDYGNVGVVTGSWNAKGQLQNFSFQSEISYMVVCVRSAGNWKVSAVQLTPVK